MDTTSVKSLASTVAFRVAALAESLDRGSYQRAIAEAVYESVRRDMDIVLDFIDEKGDRAAFSDGIPMNFVRRMNSASVK